MAVPIIGAIWNNRTKVIENLGKPWWHCLWWKVKVAPERDLVAEKRYS